MASGRIPKRGECASFEASLSEDYLPAVLKTQLEFTIRRLAVVDRVLGLRIRQVEPLLHEVDPKHPFEIVRWATPLARVIVRLDR